MKIILDAGHGYNTPGKRTPDNIREWTLNNKVANYIEEYLRGYNVEIIRTDDKSGNIDVSLAERRNKTNSIFPNLFISIHHNALTGNWGNHSGIEVYSHTLGTLEDVKFANLVSKKMSEKIGLPNRGSKKAQYYVLGCKPGITAILCEGGFMDSTIDYKIITTEDGQRKYAQAVAYGVIEYLGLIKNENSQPQANEQKELYKVKITTPVLRIRKDPNINSNITGKVFKNQVYTIVAEENGWGKLKSGAGWIYLSYTTRNINSSINPIKNNKFNVKVKKKRAMVRCQPNSKANLAGSRELHFGDVFIATDIVKGENVNGNNLWYKSAKGNYVWSGGLNRI